MYQSRNFQSAGVFSRYLLLILLILSFADANAGQFDKGLLWKIDSPDGKTSHLLGTIHLEDSRVTNLPALVQRAFDRSSRVTLEITMDPAALISLSVAMMLTDGRDLRSVIGDRLYLRSIKALEDYGLPELRCRTDETLGHCNYLVNTQTENRCCSGYEAVSGGVGRR